MSCRRLGHRKQVTEAKEGPLDLRRAKTKGNVPGGGERKGESERRGHALKRQSHININNYKYQSGIPGTSLLQNIFSKKVRNRIANHSNLPRTLVLALKARHSVQTGLVGHPQMSPQLLFAAIGS